MCLGGPSMCQRGPSMCLSILLHIQYTYLRVCGQADPLMCLGSIHTYIYVARRTLYVSRQYIYMCPGSTVHISMLPGGPLCGQADRPSTYVSRQYIYLCGQADPLCGDKKSCEG